MQIIIKINNILKYVEEGILCIMVAGMALLLVANVFCRFLLGFSLSYGEELGILLFIAATYLGCPYAVRKCKHIRMNAFIELMQPQKAKRYCMVIDTITCLGFGYLGLMMWKYALQVYALGARTAALGIPRWVCVLPIVIGLLATALQFLLLVVLNIWDKENYWLGTQRKFGDAVEEGGGLA